MNKPVAKKIVIRDPKGKNIKTFQMPYECNLMEIAYFLKEAPLMTGQWARPCTVNIETYTGKVQYTKSLRVNWKYLKRDIRELLRSYDLETQASLQWEHENGFIAA